MPLAEQQWCPTSVQVTVQQARGLRIKGKSGTNDAYAVMQVGKEKFQTSVVEKSVAPAWREEAAFDLPPPLHQDGAGGGKERGTLHVHVLHRALVGPDKLLGQAVVNLLQLGEDKTREKTEWFKLLDKTGKADKDRGEVLLDIQFMRHNMTASMFDLSASGKSRSRMGKFKDKVRGKKKESDGASDLVPSFPQVLTESDEEGTGNAEVAAGKGDKKKKHKMKSLFSHKSNLQKNMSQSMTVLTAKNFSLSGSQSSGLNVDSSEGKKKFKFLIHKRSNSSDGKDAPSGQQKHGAAEPSNVCINGSHVYCEEPPRASRIGSNFSLASSGHGSMEDVPESSPPSVDSLRGVRQYSPWTEEEEEEELENTKEDAGQLRREEEEKLRMEEMRRKEEEQRVRRKEELERLADEKRQEEEERRTEEENVRREEERREEERKQQQAEEERVKREQEECDRLAEQQLRLQEQERLIEEERVKKEEEERIHEERRKEEEMVRRQEEEREEKRRFEEQERSRKEEEERIRMEEESAQEERRQEERVREQEEERKLAEQKRLEEEERQKEEAREEKRRFEEQERSQEDERIRMEKERIRMEESAQEERRRQEEKARVRRQQDKCKLEEQKRLEEEERRKEMVRRQEEEREEKRFEEQERSQEQERIRMEEERIRMETAQEERRPAEEARVRRQEEKCKLAEEKRLEEEERRTEEDKLSEEERIRREEEMAEEEMKRREEEEMMKRQEEKREEKRRLEEQERRRREHEERMKTEEEQKAKREKEEHETLVEQKKKLEEEERKRIKAEEKIRLEEAEKIRVEEERRKEEERVRRQEEECEQLAEEKRILEEQKRRIEKERKQREEEELRRREEEENRRKEKEENERLVVEKNKREQERRKIEEEEKMKREEEERVRREAKAERERKEEEARKKEKQKLTREAEEQKKDNKSKLKAAGKRSVQKVSVESPAEVTSTNPFDESVSNNPFEELPDSPAGGGSSTAKVPTVQQRVQSAASSVGSRPISSDEKDPINTQRERRLAPQPPGRNPAERRSQREPDGATQQLAQINKKSKDKDIKTISVLPQRSVQTIAPMSRSSTEKKTTQSCATKETSNVVKLGKRTAPTTPRSVEEEPSSEDKTTLSSHDISHECGSEAKQVSIVHSLNPFDDVENAAQEDSSTSGNTGSVKWPPVVSQAADKDAASQAKTKSSKAHAPPLPAKIAATSSTSIHQNTERAHVAAGAGVTVNSVAHLALDPVSEAVRPMRVQEAPLQESQPAPAQRAGENAGGMKVGPLMASRRLQPVKPLNPLAQQSVSVQGVKDNNSTCDVQVNDTGLKGPYSQLTQGELISLVLKQEKQMSERDKKISELEKYIDDLIVRVIEEKPSILMSLNSMKKAT